MAWSWFVSKQEVETSPFNWAEFGNRQQTPVAWRPCNLMQLAWRRSFRIFLAASNFRSRSAWISYCLPASISFGVM